MQVLVVNENTKDGAAKIRHTGLVGLTRLEPLWEDWLLGLPLVLYIALRLGLKVLGKSLLHCLFGAERFWLIVSQLHNTLTLSKHTPGLEPSELSDIIQFLGSVSHPSHQFISPSVSRPRRDRHRKCAPTPPHRTSAAAPTSCGATASSSAPTGC